MARFLETRGNPADIYRLLSASGGPAPGGRYLHWDKLRHLDPPESLSTEEWWLGIKWARLSDRKEISLRDREGHLFWYVLPDSAQAMLHEIDRKAAGTIEMPEKVTNPETRDRYLTSSLIEEAITSSQLEGAATTRRVAKEMLQTGRPPRDRGEQMILNNFRAMEFVRELRDEEMTPELVRKVHRLVTAETLDDPGAAGRLRRDEDDIVVQDDRGRLLHTPPPARELPARMVTFCDFARAAESSPFLHPVVRAILLHFWLAYDHPFVDGNGRTARALFYWSLIRSGYWLCEFISISGILNQARAGYHRSFLHVETDDNDVTYFILAQLRVIIQAIEALYSYLDRKTRDLNQMRRLLSRPGRLARSLNHRQIDLLRHALRHPGFSYTFDSHRRAHNTSYQTSRTDLLTLCDLGLLDKSKAGRTFIFDAPADLQERIEDLTRPSRTVNPPEAHQP